MYSIYLVWSDGQQRLEGRARDLETATAIAESIANLYRDADVQIHNR